MKLTYDSAHNIAYLTFADKPVEVDTICLNDFVNVDFAPDGSVYGIELLDANRQLLHGDSLRFVVTNAANGTTAEVALTA